MEEFIKKLIERQQSRCIITGSSYPLALVYITPIMNESDRYDIDNALLMDPTVRALFTNKDITIRVLDHEILINEKNTDTDYIESVVQRNRVFIGRNLKIYSNFEINDKMKNNLNQHYNAFKQKQNMDRIKKNMDIIKKLKTYIEMNEESTQHHKKEICNLEEENKEYQEGCLNLKPIDDSSYDTYNDLESYHNPESDYHYYYCR